MRLKILIFILIVAVAAGNFIITPKKTEAFLGIGDVGVQSVPVLEGMSAAHFAKDIGQWIKGRCFCGLTRYSG